MSRSQYQEMVDSRICLAYRKALEMLTEGAIERKRQGESSHKPCRNPKREDYMQDFQSWTTRHAYHFLMGTGGISQIYRERLFQYAVAGYAITDSGTDSEFDIRCRDGYVRVERKPKTPIRIAKDVAKGILARL